MTVVLRLHVLLFLTLTERIYRSPDLRRMCLQTTMWIQGEPSTTRRPIGIKLCLFNGGPGNFIVWFGYADTAHTDACADTTGQVPNNCLPDNPWQGSPNTLFVGAAGGSPGAGGCARPGFSTCFDAGAIRIEVKSHGCP
jgi:hypothetical protein